MIGFFTFIHVFLCILIILIVLIQGGKGADMGAAFGGSSQTVFGPGGGVTFFTKLTTTVAILFMASCFLLAYFSSHRTKKSVVPQTIEEMQKTIPAEKAKEKDKTPPLDK